MQLQLTHYFKLKKNKICHEVTSEIMEGSLRTCVGVTDFGKLGCFLGFSFKNNRVKAKRFLLC
jgi:hypothetical protein